MTIFGDSTRVTLRNDGDSTRVTFLPNQSPRVTVNDSSQSNFHKISNIWLTNPVRSHTKKWAFFASVMINIAQIFCFDCIS